MSVIREEIQDLIEEVIDICQDSDVSPEDFKHYMKDIEDEFVDRFKELIKAALDHYDKQR